MVSQGTSVFLMLVVVAVVGAGGGGRGAGAGTDVGGGGREEEARVSRGALRYGRAAVVVGRDGVAVVRVVRRRVARFAAHDSGVGGREQSREAHVVLAQLLDLLGACGVVVAVVGGGGGGVELVLRVCVGRERWRVAAAALRESALCHVAIFLFFLFCWFFFFLCFVVVVVAVGVVFCFLFFVIIIIIVVSVCETGKRRALDVCEFVAVVAAARALLLLPSCEDLR